MKQVYIVAGGNGCGKTTLAHKLVQKLGFDFVNADEIAKSYGDIEKFKITAGKEFINTVNNLISEEKSFIVESTLSGKYFIPLLKRLQDNDYLITLVYVFIEDIELAIRRIQLRVMKGGHYIPDQDVRRRYRRSLSNFHEFYKDAVNAWEIHYNGKDEFILVATRGESKSVSIIDENLYNIFNNL